MTQAPWAGILVPPIGAGPDEWLEVAGANYEVTLEPVFLGDGRCVANRYAITGLEPYGIVKGRYRPVQNSEILARALALTGSVAGLAPLEGGRRFVVVVDTDDLEDLGTAIVVQTSHDGTLPVTFSHVAYRDGFVIDLDILSSNKARHTPNLGDTLEEARKIMAWHKRWVNAVSGRVSVYRRAPLDHERLARFVSATFDKRRQELRETILATTDAWVHRVGESAWAGALGVCQVLDAWPGFGDTEGRLVASLDDHSLLSRRKQSLVLGLVA